MEQKNESLKININKDGEEKPLRKTRKVVREKKEKMDQIERPKARTANSSMMITFIAVAVTALIVGGGLYAWQKGKIKNTVDNITNDARNARLDLEKKLSNISEKAQGLESELETLKSKNEKLSEVEILLADAKIEFANSELGIKFDYPATFGEAKVVIENGEGGKTIKGSFSKNDKLIFGGVSKNYQKASTSNATELLDFQGYKEKDKKFFFLSPLSNVDGYEMTPAGEVNSGKGKIFLLNNKSFKTKDASSTESLVNIGDNLGAIVNITNPDFGGIAFVNSDFGKMSVDDFKKMIGSIK